jgi:hypothetical protein
MAQALDLESIRHRLADSREALRLEYGLKHIGLFGSCRRGEARSDSDVDLLVELDRPIGLFRFLRMQRELAQLLGRPVDLVTPGALKPHIGAEILRTVVDV